jgi:serine/threonine-protein kinase RsbW
VVTTSPPVSSRKWVTLSFVSTLYLHPVLDLLLAHVPQQWHAEIRLGLQEALVNAAKHGNRLDPAKQISVKHATAGGYHWWIIADQGPGFHHPCNCEEAYTQNCFSHPGDCGRGLYILYQIFDEVRWHEGGRELHLSKVMRQQHRLPLIY